MKCRRPVVVDIKQVSFTPWWAIPIASIHILCWRRLVFFPCLTPGLWDELKWPIQKRCMFLSPHFNRRKSIDRHIHALASIYVSRLEFFHLSSQSASINTQPTPPGRSDDLPKPTTEAVANVESSHRICYSILITLYFVSYGTGKPACRLYRKQKPVS